MRDHARPPLELQPGPAGHRRVLLVAGVAGADRVVADRPAQPHLLGGPAVARRWSTVPSGTQTPSSRRSRSTAAPATGSPASVDEPDPQRWSRCRRTPGALVELDLGDGLPGGPGRAGQAAEEQGDDRGEEGGHGDPKDPRDPRDMAAVCPGSGSLMPAAGRALRRSRTAGPRPTRCRETADAGPDERRPQEQDREEDRAVPGPVVGDEQRDADGTEHSGRQPPVQRREEPVPDAVDDRPPERDRHHQQEGDQPGAERIGESPRVREPRPRPG